MAHHIENDADTAVTVFADDSIKELLKSEKIEDIQKIVQEDESSLPVNASCLAWSKGQVVGKFEIIKRIGKGGMGVIYLARHTQLDTLRALKVLPAESAEEHPVFAERFIREARIASQIRHPNIVEVMDVESDPQMRVTYIVMEYIDGGSLRQILKCQQKLNVEQAIVVIQSVASALAVAAEYGIVHRDIKPDNIMFTRRGGVKLADLGIAKKDDEDDNLTKTNVMMGTPAYLSPEQVENPKGVDIRSDIYSLGATFYEMLTGSVPYPGKTSYDILRRIFSEPVPDPRKLNPDVPGEVAAIVMKMLAKEPDKRYQTPEKLLEALEKIIPTLSEANLQLVIKSIVDLKCGSYSDCTHNSAITGTLYGRRRRRRSRRMLAAIAGGLILLGSIAAGIFYKSQTAAPLDSAPEPDKILTPVPAPAPEPIIVLPIQEKTPVAVKEPAPAEVPSEKTLPAPDAVTVLPAVLDITTTAGAAIRLVAEDGQNLTYTGNRKGECKITGLKPGRYELKISHPDFITYNGKVIIPTDTELKILLKPDWRSLTVKGPAGTKLELRYSGGGQHFFSIPERGDLKIEKLQRGDYLLQAAHQDYFIFEKTLKIDKDLVYTLPLEKKFKRLALVTQPGGRVELLQNSQIKYVQHTDNSGRCIFQKILKGVYELRVTMPHYKEHRSILNIERDISQTVKLSKQLYSLTLYGLPGTSGRMYFDRKMLRNIEIDSSGFFSITDVEPGEYIFDFDKKGYVSQKYRVNVNSNTTLQVNLVPAQVKVPVKVAMGNIRIYFSSSSEMMRFMQKNGIEIRIDNGAWEPVKEFPFSRKLAAGRVLIDIRGKGVLPRFGQEVYITANQNTDVMIDLKAVPSNVVLVSNRPDAKFIIADNVCQAGSKVKVETFLEYEVTAESENQVKVKKVFSSIPGDTLTVSFDFTEKVHSMHTQYEEGIKLFDQRDYKEALQVLLTAAEADHPEACFRVAEIYDKGLGMWFSSKSSARYWYVKAAQMGNPIAAGKIADAIFDGDYEAPASQMVKFYLLAVKANIPECTYKLSLIYKNGFEDIKPDEAKALQYLTKAAELGVPDAMYDLGIRYEKGQGVPFNSKTSLFWIKKAADAGHIQAKKYWDLLNQ